jgi:methylmalonyl-CoA mutase
LASGFPSLGEADWRVAAAVALKGGSLDALTSKTSDGIPLGPLYSGRTGPRAMRGAGGPWRMLARLDHPNAGDANAQALEDLANGADGLQITFAGSVGAHGWGLAQGDSATLHRALEGVRFEEGARFELDLGLEAAAHSRAFAGVIERSGARPEAVDLSFGLDPLGNRARSGRATKSWDEEARALAAAVAEFAGAGFVGPFLVADGRGIHAAGGTPAQELAFALASAVSYARALTDHGVALEAARAAIMFRMAADADQYVTLCKFRALRLLWARVVEACGLPPGPARIHAESAWRMMSARDPFSNVMRGALAAFSAGLGGADSIALLPFSQAIGLPDSFARRLARNTQLIELRESHLGFVADPAAGAGGFEALTRALCEKAWAMFQSWESEGGLPSVLAKGDFQREVGTAAAALARDVARLKTPITGVSAHPDLAEARINVAAGEASEVEFPGEVFAPPLIPIRVAAPFERLRDAADALPARPRMFLAAIGPLVKHARRVGFARELFEAGGVAAIADPGAANAEASAARFTASGARMACLCGADEDYRESAGEVARSLKRAGASHLLLAGRPGEHESEWRAAGVDDFIFAGCDAVAALEIVLRRAGASL